MEDEMTRKFLISAGLTAFSGTMFALALAAPGSQASVGLEFGHCASDSKGKTIHCCETQMENASLLVKQLISGRNCERAVRCSVRINGRRCIVKLIRPRDGGGIAVEAGGSRGNYRGAVK
jgi:hypothetical protein